MTAQHAKVERAQERKKQGVGDGSRRRGWPELRIREFPNPFELTFDRARWRRDTRQSWQDGSSKDRGQESAADGITHRSGLRHDRGKER